jgi:hypothetical protein
MVCTFDHRAVGTAAGEPRGDCPQGSDDPVCTFAGFYDPIGLGVYGSVTVDYIPLVFPYPNRICSYPEVQAGHGEAGGKDAFCAASTLSASGDIASAGFCYKMTCSSADELTIYVGNQANVCPYPGASLTFAGYSGAVTCPDPRVICGIVNYGANHSGYSEGVPPASTSALPTPGPSVTGTATAPRSESARASGSDLPPASPAASPSPQGIVLTDGTSRLESTAGLVNVSGSGKIQNVEGDGAPLVLGELVIADGSKVTADNLQIGSGLDLSGTSSLGPDSDEDRITLPHASVDIALRPKGESFPTLSLGAIGMSYSVLPRSLEVDFSGIGTLGRNMNWIIVQGNTLSNCKDWIPLLNKTGLDGGSELFTAQCFDNQGRKIDVPSETISLRMVFTHSVPPATNKLYAGLEIGAWIGIGVSVFVAIVICIVVQVFCCKAGQDDDALTP